MDFILETEGLTKLYRNEKVVDNVKLNIRAGEIYGLLGENGAGKTTLMKMITTLVVPSQGKIKLFGQELRGNTALLQQVGALIETPVFYDTLSAEENLKIHCQYKNIPTNSIKEYLQLLGIYDHRHKKVKQYSLGMKQRLGIARAIIGQPRFLVLDEPINGLDPTGIKEIRELFQYLNREKQTTILISSHILNEIEQCASTIGFMNKGVLREEINMDEIHNAATLFYEIKINHLQAVEDTLKKLFQVVDTSKNHVRISAGNLNTMDVTKLLIQHDIEFSEIKPSGDTLEDYYIKKILHSRESQNELL